MEDSILKSIRAMLNLEPTESTFDGEIVPWINATFSTLKQLGVENSMTVGNAEEKWSDLNLPSEQLNLVKTLIQMKVKLAFDPPGTSYLLETTKELIKEQEFRVMTFAECTKTWPTEEVVTP